MYYPFLVFLFPIRINSVDSDMIIIILNDNGMAIAPNIGPVSPHINICSPIDSPASVKEIPRSSLKSIKNKPKVCLIPKDIKTTTQAAIKVIKAVLFLINLNTDLNKS